MATVLIHPGKAGRWFIPDGETALIASMRAQGYVDWKKPGEVKVEPVQGIPAPVEHLGLPDYVTDMLREAGYETEASVRAAADADLLAIDGIGPGRLREIRYHLNRGTHYQEAHSAAE